MPAVKTGQTATVLIPTGYTLEVGAGCMGRVVVNRPGSSSEAFHFGPSSASYGPFPANRNAQLICDQGVMSYHRQKVIDSRQPILAPSLDIAAPSTRMLENVQAIWKDDATGACYRSDGSNMRAISEKSGGLITTEAPIKSADAPAAAPYFKFLRTIASDGDGTGNVHQDWGGMQKENEVRMEDGSLFRAQVRTSSVRLLRSNGGENDPWEEVAVHNTDVYKTLVLRFRAPLDQVVWVTAVGTNPNYSIRLMVFDKAGKPVGSPFVVNIPGIGIGESLTNAGFYFNAGVGTHGNTGQMVIAGSNPPANGQFGTLGCYLRWQWLDWDGQTWSKSGSVQKMFTDTRLHYHDLVIGADGNPNLVYGFAQADVAMWEAQGLYERLSPARLPTFYAFHEFYVFGHDRETGDKWCVKVSPPAPWVVRPWDGDGSAYNAANDIPEVRSRQRMMHIKTGDWWTIYKYKAPKPYDHRLEVRGTVVGSTLTVDASSNATFTGSINGTTLTVPAQSVNGTILRGQILTGAGIQSGTKIVRNLTGLGGQGTYEVSISQTTPSTTITAQVAALPKGTWLFAHSGAATGMLPCQIIDYGTGTGAAGNVGGTYTLTVPQSLGLVNGNPTVGTLKGCNDANPTVSQVPTSGWRLMIVSPRGEIRWDGDLLPNIAFGNFSLEQTEDGRVFAHMVGMGPPTDQTVCHLWELTMTPEGGVNQIALDKASSLNCADSPPGNVGFGTAKSYYGMPLTLPARCSNQGPTFPSVHHGSKPASGYLDVFYSRRATDHSAAGTDTLTGDASGHKIDHGRICV